MSLAAHRPDLAADVRATACDPWTVCERLGIVDAGDRKSYQRQARGVIVRCPAHGERTPSCSVRVGDFGTIACHCFSCGWTGDVFSLVALVHSLDVRRDFRRVVEITAGLVGMNVDGAAPVRFVRVVPPPQPARLNDATFDVIAAQLDPLDAHPDVAAYTRARLPGCEVTDLRALPASWSGLGAVRDRIVRVVGAEAWQRSGLARDDGRWLFAEHRVVILWRGADGLVSTVQRRIMRELRDGERVGKYVFATGRAPREPFGVERLASMGPGDAVAFCEGALDAIALRAISAREGLAWTVLGLAGLGAWDRTFALHARGRVAVVALDADEHGDAKAPTLAADLRAHDAVMVERARPDAPAKDWSAQLVMESGRDGR